MTLGQPFDTPSISFERSRSITCVMGSRTVLGEVGHRVTRLDQKIAAR
jgi:hypothetical protein